MPFMDQQRLRWLASLGVAALSGCGPYVEGSAVATHTADDAHFVDASRVRVSVLAIPEGATEVGIVQARVTAGNIEDAMPEFRAQVARLGGDFGKINDVQTKFEMKTRTRSETYSCGSSDHPRSCTRLITEQVEVSTTSVIGKAYRSGAPAPPAQPATPAQAAPATPPQPADTAASVDPPKPQEDPAPAPAPAPAAGPEEGSTAP